jgi:hypothetical protein
MTSNSSRSDWTTWGPWDRPPHSTPRPKEEGALRSSSCLHARRRRNRHALRRPLPLLPPTSTMTVKARVRTRRSEKARITTPTALATTTVTTAPAHEACRDRPSLCAGMRGHRWCPRPTCVDNIPICGHLHEGFAYFSIFGVSVQSQYLQC